MNWTDEEIAFAAKLWNDGKSAGEVSQALLSEMGVKRSRGAITGASIRHRDMFQRKGKGINRRAEHILKLKYETRISAPPPANIQCRNVTLIERQEGECCFVTNEGGPFLYCALPTDNSGSYCGFHKRLMYGPGTESERSAHRVLEAA